MIDANDPEVKTANQRARELLAMVKEWSVRRDEMLKDPNTTDEEHREWYKLGLDMVVNGLDIAIPFMNDEDFPADVRKTVEEMMAEIPIFREVNGIQ